MQSEKANRLLQENKIHKMRPTSKASTSKTSKAITLRRSKNKENKENEDPLSQVNQSVDMTVKNDVKPNHDYDLREKEDVSYVYPFKPIKIQEFKEKYTHLYKRNFSLCEESSNKINFKTEIKSNKRKRSSSNTSKDSSKEESENCISPEEEIPEKKRRFSRIMVFDSESSSSSGEENHPKQNHRQNEDLLEASSENPPELEISEDQRSEDFSEQLSQLLKDKDAELMIIHKHGFVKRLIEMYPETFPNDDISEVIEHIFDNRCKDVAILNKHDFIIELFTSGPHPSLGETVIAEYEEFEGKLIEKENLESTQYPINEDLESNNESPSPINEDLESNNESPSPINEDLESNNESPSPINEDLGSTLEDLPLDDIINETQEDISTIIPEPMIEDSTPINEDQSASFEVQSSKNIENVSAMIEDSFPIIEEPSSALINEDRAFVFHQKIEDPQSETVIDPNVIVIDDDPEENTQNVVVLEDVNDPSNQLILKTKIQVPEACNKIQDIASSLIDKMLDGLRDQVIESTLRGEENPMDEDIFDVTQSAEELSQILEYLPQITNQEINKSIREIIAPNEDPQEVSNKMQKIVSNLINKTVHDISFAVNVSILGEGNSSINGGIQEVGNLTQNTEDLCLLIEDVPEMISEEEISLNEDLLFFCNETKYPIVDETVYNVQHTTDPNVIVIEDDPTENENPFSFIITDVREVNEDELENPKNEDLQNVAEIDPNIEDLQYVYKIDPNIEELQNVDLIDSNIEDLQYFFKIDPNIEDLAIVVKTDAIIDPNVIIIEDDQMECNPINEDPP